MDHTHSINNHTVTMNQYYSTCVLDQAEGLCAYFSEKHHIQE